MGNFLPHPPAIFEDSIITRYCSLPCTTLNDISGLIELNSDALGRLRVKLFLLVRNNSYPSYTLRLLLLPLIQQYLTQNFRDALKIISRIYEKALSLLTTPVERPSEISTPALSRSR
jgi:hypothetical protein